MGAMVFGKLKPEVALRPWQGMMCSHLVVTDRICGQLNTKGGLYDEQNGADLIFGCSYDHMTERFLCETVVCRLRPRGNGVDYHKGPKLK